MLNAGNLFVIAAPSGTGKTSLVKALTEKMDNIIVSISHTTRKMRPGEKNGVNYHFISKNEFEEMIQHDDFLEHANIFDNHYGTSKQWVSNTLKTGTDVILEIDWQGHQQIKKLIAETISIFILPPSLHQLRERLFKRNQDHPDIIAKRLADAKTTVSHINEFDYVVINDEFDKAMEDLSAIVKAARLRQAVQIQRCKKILESF